MTKSLSRSHQSRRGRPTTGRRLAIPTTAKVITRRVIPNTEIAAFVDIIDDHRYDRRVSGCQHDRRRQLADYADKDKAPRDDDVGAHQRRGDAPQRPEPGRAKDAPRPP